MGQLRALLAEPADPLGEPFLVGTAATVAQWADELDEADRLVERGLALQCCSLLHPMYPALVNTRADIAAARGDHARLLAPLADAADRRAARTGRGPANADAHVLMALVHTGRIDEAQRFAAAFDLRRAPDSWELNRFLYARGVLRAAVGDAAGALHDFLECGRRQSAREVLSPVVTPWRTAIDPHGVNSNRAADPPLAGPRWHQSPVRGEGGGIRTQAWGGVPMPDGNKRRQRQTGRDARELPDTSEDVADAQESEASRRRRRVQFLRELHEAKQLRDRVQPRRARAARMRQAMRMRTFRW